MRSLLFVFILFFGLLSDSTAMVAASRNFARNVPFFCVRVFSHPIVEIIKLPSEQGILVDGNLMQSINAERGIKYKGITLQDDLFLTYSMPDTEFYNRIYQAFDKVTCVQMKVSMPRELFETIFFTQQESDLTMQSEFLGENS